MTAIDKIEKIQTDFQQQNAPFNDVTFPEERLIREISVLAGDDEPMSLSMEDRLCLVSAFATFDYNRDANQLVDNLLMLYKRQPGFFDAWELDGSEAVVEEIFESIGFRYPSRDAHAWSTNCAILRHEYHGKWSELMMDTGLDAERLIDRLNDDDFLCLKGVKIAPMYARIIDEFVAPMDNLWDIEIPVDTHIRRLSKDLFDAPDKDDDWIRREWRAVSAETDVGRHVVDGALWHIGNKWDDWGEDYWENL